MNFLTHINPGTEDIIRSCSIEGAAWFNAAELCRLLGHSHVTKALKFLEPQEKMTVTSDSLEMSKMDISSGSHGGGRRMVLVNESGLYGLIFRSRHPQAVAIRLWVTGVVLPTIRQQSFFGTFIPGAASALQLAAAYRLLNQERAACIASSETTLAESGYLTFRAFMQEHAIPARDIPAIASKLHVRAKADGITPTQVTLRGYPNPTNAWPRELLAAAVNSTTPRLF